MKFFNNKIRVVKKFIVKKCKIALLKKFIVRKFHCKKKFYPEFYGVQDDLKIK